MASILHDCAGHFLYVTYKLLALELVLAFCSRLRPAWLISGVLNVRLIFSAVQCSVLAVIDSAAIATTVSNPGE